jgi:hypothetical protein
MIIINRLTNKKTILISLGGYITKTFRYINCYNFRTYKDYILIESYDKYELLNIKN